jgi:hypothetical protein
MDGEVESAMQTPDGAWRVEVVRRGRSRWYRVVNDARDVELDWLTIAAVERILDELGVNMADLTECRPPRAAARRHGAA